MRGLVRPAFFPSVGAPQVRMMWIVDTGCGSDLVDARHVKHIRKNFRRTSSKMMPSGAGGYCPVDWESTVVAACQAEVDASHSSGQGIVSSAISAVL